MDQEANEQQKDTGNVVPACTPSRRARHWRTAFSALRGVFSSAPKPPRNFKVKKRKKKTTNTRPALRIFGWRKSPVRGGDLFAMSGYDCVQYNESHTKGAATRSNQTAGHNEAECAGAQKLRIRSGQSLLCSVRGHFRATAEKCSLYRWRGVHNIQCANSA